jgi:hypothetical protein
MVVPTVEPEPAAPQIVAPADDDEPPPFVMGDAPIESSEIAFPSFVVPEPAPAPVVTATPAYDEPPVIEAAPPPAESPTIAMTAPSAAPAAAPPPDEPPAPMVTSSASPLPLVMPEKNRLGRARASIPPPPAREPITPSSRSSRPSKEDLAALDDLLNARSTEGPLTPLEKPGGFAERPAPQYARSGGGRRQTSGRGPLLLGLAAVLLGLAAGGWYYFNGMPGRAGLFARASPAPGAVTSPLPATPTTTLAPAAVLPSPVPVAPSAAAATSGPAPPTVAPATAPPPMAVATPRPTPPAATPDGRALLRTGRFPEAARAFASSTRAAGKSAAVIQLLIACSAETVQKAIDSGSASDLVILPVDFKGRDCYRLVWGVYPSAARATAALPTVPEYFRNGGAVPKVLGVSEVVP